MTTKKKLKASKKTGIDELASYFKLIKSC